MPYSGQPVFSAHSAPINAPPLQSYYNGYPTHLGQLQLQQPRHQDGCYECGNIGHIRRYCPRLASNKSRQDSRAIIPAPVASLPAQPARGRGQAVRGRGQAIRGGGQTVRGGGQLVRRRPRDAVQSGGVQPRFYAFPARLEAESSDDVITGIIPVFHRDASVLFDPGSTYSYVSSYFASYLVVPCDSLSASVCVSTPVGDSVVVDHVYRLCVVTIDNSETSVDLLLLDMVDFDIILGMDWMSPYHAILDCHAKTVTLAMPGLPRFSYAATSVSPCIIFHSVYFYFRQYLRFCIIY